ncbi:MAG: tetratricopeptide repeat protein [Bacillota bacterium]
MTLPRRWKTWQKVGFWAITVLIAVGLVAPSVVGLWGLEGQDRPEVPGPAPALDDFAREVRQLEQKVRDNPSDVESRIRLAVAYRDMMDYERSIALFEETLALEAGNQRVRLDLAEMYLQLGEHEQAIGQLEALLETNPEHHRALYLYGLALGSGREDYPEAVRALERFLALVGTGPEAEYARTLIQKWTAGQKR